MVRYGVEGFRKIKYCNVSSKPRVQSFCPVIDCQDQLGLTGMTRSKAVLSRCQYVAFLEVSTDARMDNVLHDFTAY